jgi:hypothetical protein
VLRAFAAAPAAAASQRCPVHPAILLHFARYGVSQGTGCERDRLACQRAAEYDAGSISVHQLQASHRFEALDHSHEITMGLGAARV